MALKSKPLPDAGWLREAIDYDPETGLFCWKQRPEHHFVKGKFQRRFNTLFAGSPAFVNVNARGYFVGKLGKRKVQAHRVAWKMMTGDDPNIIDHIDGNPLNNRFSNLRSTTCVVNSRNYARKARAASGVIGVRWAKDAQRWIAMIVENRSQKHLGTYVDLKDAVVARLRAERQYGYTRRCNAAAWDAYGHLVTAERLQP